MGISVHHLTAVECAELLPESRLSPLEAADASEQGQHVIMTQNTCKPRKNEGSLVEMDLPLCSSWFPLTFILPLKALVGLWFCLE